MVLPDGRRDDAELIVLTRRAAETGLPLGGYAFYFHYHQQRADAHRRGVVPVDRAARAAENARRFTSASRSSTSPPASRPAPTVAWRIAWAR